LVKKIVLFDKLYGFSNEKTKKLLIKKYNKYLSELTKGFENLLVSIKKLRDYDNRLEVMIKGPEEVFLFNLLKKEIGTIHDFSEIKENIILKGNLTDVGKVGFGIFVDCGILNPKTDILLSLRTLREQLCNNKQKSLTQIIKAYDLVDHFPVEIEVVNIKRENNEIQGKLTQSTLQLFKKLVDENLEAIFVSGQTKGQLKKALIKLGHLRDIVSIKRYGFLENIVIFKQGTEAPGIIANIGKLLKKCKISAIRPAKIRKLILE